MKDFIMAALPWLIIGLALAILAANAVKKKGNNIGVYVLLNILTGNRKQTNREQ